MSNPYGEPLYGHTTQDTALLVPDYPYGARLRCKIRYWLEKKPSHGFRLVSQTENPKNSRWNKPHPGQYNRFAGAMYRDGKGHVQWIGIGEYSTIPEIAAFVTAFPKADFSLLKPFVMLKAALYKRVLDSGKAMFSINGDRKDLTEQEKGEYRADIESMKEIIRKIG